MSMCVITVCSECIDLFNDALNTFLLTITSALDVRCNPSGSVTKVDLRPTVRERGAYSIVIDVLSCFMFLSFLLLLLGFHNHPIQLNNHSTGA